MRHRVSVASVQCCERVFVLFCFIFIGYKELFKGNMYDVPSSLEAKVHQLGKKEEIDPSKLIVIMVANWDTGEITPMTVESGHNKGEKESDQPTNVGVVADVEADSNNNLEITTNIMKGKGDNMTEANDCMIAKVLSEIEFEKKELTRSDLHDEDETKIRVDMSEQEKNDVMISIVLTEEEKEKKLLANSDPGPEKGEAKIVADHCERESTEFTIKLSEETPTSEAAVSHARLGSTSDVETPTTTEVRPPTNTPTTVETKKKQVSISPKQECIPTRLQRMCAMIKEFYEALGRFFQKKNLKAWTPLHIHTLFNETLMVGLEDFHKYEQHVLLNCLFDHWHPSVADWAEFITLIHEDLKVGVCFEDEDESLQSLAAELLWWIKEKGKMHTC